ncbi:chloride channel protein [Sinomonas soli]
MPSASVRGARWRSAARAVGDRVGVSSLYLVALAVLVGLGAGLAAVGFRWLIVGATQIFSGTADYAATTGNPANHWVPWLGPAFVVLAPAVGGLVYGPLVHLFAREARGHGVPEVMYAVARKGGRIKGRVAVVKALASALTIGSGGSVGREGPIVQIGSALGSRLGTLAGFSESQLRTLVACGAAGGIAATFNAPLAGVFFALELILRDFAARSFAAVMLSSIAASVVGRSLLGNYPFLPLPAFTVSDPGEMLVFALLGLVAGGVGVLFSKVLYAIEDACDWLWRGPEWLRPAVGGLLLGCLLLVLPQMYGVGYPVLQNSILGHYALPFLLLLTVAKMAATSLTIGIGGSGGVFAPSLFIGATTGAAFGQIAAAAMPSLAGQTGAFALVGMGAVFAGSTRAAITAGLIIFELTGEYSLILPLLLAVLVATAVSALASRDTIYTRKLLRRGIDLSAPQQRGALHGLTVAQAMTAPPQPLAATLPVREAAALLAGSAERAAPVVDGARRLTGVVTAAVLAEGLEDDDVEGLTAGDLAQSAGALREADELSDGVDLVLAAADTDGLPVVDEEGVLTGWLDTKHVLRWLMASS